MLKLISLEFTKGMKEKSLENTLDTYVPLVFFVPSADVTPIYLILIARL